MDKDAPATAAQPEPVPTEAEQQRPVVERLSQQDAGAEHARVMLSAGLQGLMLRELFRRYTWK